MKQKILKRLKSALNIRKAKIKLVNKVVKPFLIFHLHSFLSLIVTIQKKINKIMKILFHEDNLKVFIKKGKKI